MALPDTCLARIMTCLADSLEPGGLRGPSAVAADLARAAEVREAGGGAVCGWRGEGGCVAVSAWGPVAVAADLA